METRAWAAVIAAALLVALLVAAVVATLAVCSRPGSREGFDDMGPRNEPVIVPCQVYYTPDKARCDAGDFDVARATYRARVAELEARAAASQAPLSAADSAALARARASLVAFDGLTGPACKVTFPAPWFRAVSDPDDTVYSNRGGASDPDPMACFVPASDATDYAKYATSAAVVPDDAGAGATFTFGVDGAMQTFRRVAFSSVASADVAGGFYCNLPDVVNGRATDPAYDTGVGDASSLLTFRVRVAAGGALVLRALVVGGGAAASDALKARLRLQYDEVMSDDGVAATLTWAPRFESSVRVLRLQRDACGVEYVTATTQDTAKVGVPVKLQAYRSSPRPVVFGSTADILAEAAALQVQLKAARLALVQADALLRKQQRRYDTVMDVLTFMLYQWELQHSGEVPRLVAQAAQGRARPDVAAQASPGDAPAMRPAVDPVAPVSAIAVPASLQLGHRPYASRLVPTLAPPTFSVATTTAGVDVALTDTTEQYVTAPAMCPPGSYVTAAKLTVDGSGQLSGTVGVHVTVACRDPANNLTVASSGFGMTAAEMANYRVYRPKTGPNWRTDYPSSELYDFQRSDASKGDTPFYKFGAVDKDQCFNVCAQYGDECKMANFDPTNGGNNCHLFGTVGDFKKGNDTVNTINWVKDATGVSGMPAPADSNATTTTASSKT